MSERVYRSLEKSIQYIDLDGALQRLQSAHEEWEHDQKRPEHVLVTELLAIPKVFQVRGEQIVEYHAEELKRLIQDGVELDPITVMRIGADIVVVNGHHRREAYRRASMAVGKPLMVAVDWFDGSPREALKLAATVNAKRTLQMGISEKTDLAWRIVKLGPEAYSKAEISRMTDVSERTVATMRKVWKECRGRVEAVREWWRARKIADDGIDPGDGTWSDDLEAARREQTIRTLADRVGKAVGNTLVGMPIVAAHVLQRHFGKRSEEVREEWAEVDDTVLDGVPIILPGDEDPADEDF